MIILLIFALVYVSPLSRSRMSSTIHVSWYTSLIIVHRLFRLFVFGEDRLATWSSYRVPGNFWHIRNVKVDWAKLSQKVLYHLRYRTFWLSLAQFTLRVSKVAWHPVYGHSFRGSKTEVQVKKVQSRTSLVAIILTLFSKLLRSCFRDSLAFTCGSLRQRFTLLTLVTLCGFLALELWIGRRT